MVIAMRGSGGLRRVLVGRDTRESGSWIEEALARGARTQGAEIVSAGIMPTPAIAYLTRSAGFDAGIVISASHNPYEDNGIKVFSGRGEKFNDALQAQVEEIVADRAWAVPDTAATPIERRNFDGEYVAHALLALPDPAPVRHLRLAVDCANGAMTTVAPRAFRECGFDPFVIGASPDGRNINRSCGSTHPELVAQTVVEHGLDLGVAFDGDGDRAIFADRRGSIVGGDAVLLMSAKHLKAAGRLRGNAVVATIMSNLGLELALRDAQIELIRCPVGDRYVMEEMQKRNLSLGGEQSGHIIFADHLFTGDGLVTALSVMRTIAETGRDLATLAADLVTYPQVLLNVPVARKPDVDGVPPLAEAIASVERRLAGGGRLLVRYSGTEPLLRVMLEGRDETEIREWGQEIADVARRHLN
jgi:phosphoglucosamine mutase